MFPKLFVGSRDNASVNTNTYVVCKVALKKGFVAWYVTLLLALPMTLLMGQREE